MLNTAKEEAIEQGKPQIVKPHDLQDFMNYPYTRATDIIGASMATPIHLLKERTSPRRGLNPSEIMA